MVSPWSGCVSLAYHSDRQLVKFFWVKKGDGRCMRSRSLGMSLAGASRAAIKASQFSCDRVMMLSMCVPLDAVGEAVEIAVGQFDAGDPAPEESPVSDPEFAVAVEDVRSLHWGAFQNGGLSSAARASDGVDGYARGSSFVSLAYHTDRQFVNTLGESCRSM